MYKLAAKCCFEAFRDRSRWGNDVVAVGGLIGTFQSPEDGSLVPARTSFPLYTIRHSSMSNVILHPASQNFLVETNNECESQGTTYASVILLGSHGIIDPFGSFILSGLVAGSLFFTAPFIKKYAVAPESRIANCVGIFWLVDLLSSSDDISSSVRSAVAAVALSHLCLHDLLEVAMVLSSSSSLLWRVDERGI